MKKFIILILLLELLLVGALLLSPDQVSAQNGEPVELANPLRFVGVEGPADLVVRGLQGFAAVMGALAIAFVVFNAFKLIVAQTEESITNAKQSLKWSVGGFIVALLAFTLISGFASLAGFAPSEIPIGEDRLASPLSGPVKPGDFVSVMNFIMMNVLGLLGFATTLMIIYYGFRYVMSRGNEEEVERAKQGLKWAVLGFVVAILAFTIITFVRMALFNISS